jgi:hypothetical protein
MDDLTKEPIEEKISNLEKCKKGMEFLSEVVSKSEGGFPVFHAPPPPPVVTHDERILGKILEEMYSTYVKKNADYGNSFEKSIDKFGLVASAVRLSDKLERFSNLICNDAQVKDESIEDTLLDMANYAAMTVLFLRKEREKMDNLKKQD